MVWPTDTGGLCDRTTPDKVGQHPTTPPVQQRLTTDPWPARASFAETAASQAEKDGPALDMSEFPALGSAAAARTAPPGLDLEPKVAGHPGAGSSGPHGQPGQQRKPIPADHKERYGLNGLLGVIRMENNDQTTVAIGNDLTTMGLNMNPSAIPLSKSFGSPWTETSVHKPTPEYSLPSCYNVPSAPPQQTKIQSFTDETLFFIFYTMPRDSMQEAVAVELTNRNWRYHKELKLWLTKDPLTEPVQQTAQSERGLYIFFDPSSWTKIKKEFVLFYQAIA